MEYTNVPSTNVPNFGTASQQLYQDAKPVPTDPFQELRKAQDRFQKACYQVQQANAERADADKHLRQITNECAMLMEAALADPTVPQAAHQMPAANGRY